MDRPNPQPEPLAITCRRCGQAFGHDPGLRLASCPHCGASVRPLARFLRHNGLGAVLALVAMGVLTAAILLPFVSMSKLGRVQAYSLIGGIRELFDRGYFFIGAILLIFSVIFPYLKLLGLLLATSRLAPLSLRTRRRLHTLAHLTGRYSLLDLLVVAVMIVVVRLQGVLEVAAEAGTILFGVAVLLSIAAGLCVKVGSEEATP